MFVASALLNDADADLNYAGALVLAKEGLEKEAAPPLAARFLKTDSMSRGLLMSDIPLSAQMGERICAYFQANLSRYSRQELERIRRICPQVQ